MKTFKHTINGKEYTLRLQGTVGIQVFAAKIVPDEADRTTTYTDEDGKETTTSSMLWLAALLYVVFYTSNKGVEDTIDFMDFFMSFSRKEFNDAVGWYFEAYAEREGILPAPDATVPSESSEGEDEGDQKNA